MAILELLLAGLAGYIVGIFLIGVTACFLTFWISIELALRGNQISENLGVAARQLWGVAFTIGIIHAVYSVQGLLFSTAFTVGYLWTLLGMVWNRLTHG
jgi:hypothetical protein